MLTELVDLKHALILHMALKLRSAVADEKPTELYNRRRVWTWGAHFLKDGLKFIMFITDATDVTDVIGILLSALKRSRKTGSCFNSTDSLVTSITLEKTL